MKALYILGGIASIVLGIFFLRSVRGNYKRKVPDELGYNYKGIMAGFCLIIIGIYLIAKVF
jgi:hypothetical protein